MKGKVANQKSALLIGKIFSIIYKIGLVLEVIAIVAMVCCMTGVLFLSANIKLGDGKFKVFKQTITYVADENDNTLTFTERDNGFVLEPDTITAIYKDYNAKDVVEFIDGISVWKIAIIIELVCASLVYTLILGLMIIKKIIDVIDDTVRTTTPFIQTNAENLYLIAKYSIIQFVGVIAFNIVVSAMTNSSVSVSDFASSSLITAGFAYILSWVVVKGMNKGVKSVTVEKKEEAKKKASKK